MSTRRCSRSSDWRRSWWSRRRTMRQRPCSTRRSRTAAPPSGSRSIEADPRSQRPMTAVAAREPRFRWQPWAAWIVAIAVVLYWGFGLVGVDFKGLSIVPAPRLVALTSEPPATIHTPQLALSGITKPLALISTFVDGSRLPFAPAGNQADFHLTVDIGEAGAPTTRFRS